MRIYKLAEFLDLPKGTIYAPRQGPHHGIESYSFGDVYVKGDNARGSSWYAWMISQFDYHDTGQYVERVDAMANEGASFPLDDTESRHDGDPADTFLVYERADLDRLAAAIDAAKAVAR